MSWVATAIIGSSIISGVTGSQAASSAARAQQNASNAATAEQRRQFDLIRGDTAPYRQVGNQALNALAGIYGFAPSTAERDAETQRLQNVLAAMPERVQTGFESVRTGMDGNRADVYEQRPVWQDNTQARADLQAQIDQLANQPVAQPFDITQTPGYQFNLQEGQKAIDRSLAARGRALSGAGVREGVRYASGLASNEFGNYFNRLASMAGIGQAGVNTSANAGMNAGNNISNNLLAAGNARANSYMNSAGAINNAVQGGISNYMLADYLRSPVAGDAYMPAFGRR